VRCLALLALLSTCAAADLRTWTDRAGRTFQARIVACDGMRATLDVEGRGKVIVPFTALAPIDVEFARHWRIDTPMAPLIDPDCLPAWPAQVAAPAVTLQAVPGNDASAAAAQSQWESAHFRIESDLRLPLGVVRDLASVLEATREAIIATPLGLHPGQERRKYAVLLFSNVEEYGRAGGNTASGGTFNGRQLLILLPNLGIKPGTNGLDANHAHNLFILKHEVTHQLLQPWGWTLPPWLGEGFAECVASWPYTQGHYSLQNLDSAMHDYLLKWRRNVDQRALHLVAPAVFMKMSSRDWQNNVAAQTAYDHYNSAALLVHYFLRHDGRGDSAGLVRYFDALRRGMSPAEAETRHLLRGRSPDDLLAQLQKLARTLGLQVQINERSPDGG
jgi:hypothetical protein